MSIAYIGVGSNLGSREQNCLLAVSRLSGKGVTVRQHSSLCETEPWGVKDQPRFLNMVLEIETTEEPEALLRILKGIELELGRQETTKWGPRTIDLDILLYDDRIVRRADLQIPHPHMHKRDFVLRPLSEIAPEKIHPVFNKSIMRLLAEIEENKPAEPELPQN